MPKRNLAARAGHWSARHRKIADLRLARVRRDRVRHRRRGRHEDAQGRGHRQRLLARRRQGDQPRRLPQAGRRAGAGPGPRRRQGQGRRSGFTAAVKDVVDRLEARPLRLRRRSRRSPRATRASSPRTAAPRSSPSRSRATTTSPRTASTPHSPPPPPRRRQHPDLRIEQFGDASADKALSASRSTRTSSAPRSSSLPITLLILIVAFGALVAAGVPLLLALTAVIGTLGLIGPISQIFPMDESVNSVVLLIGLAVGVDYSMFYLRRKMEERDAGRSQRGGARVRRRHVRQGRARLRRHRADRDGRHVPGRQRRLHLASPSARCSSSPSPCSAASPSSPRCSPSSATRSRRAACRCIGQALRHRNHGESRVWGWVLDRVLARPALAPSLAGGRAAGARLPGAEHAHDQPGRRGPPAQPAGDADLRPHPGRVPRRPAARVGRGPGRRRHHAAPSRRASRDDPPGARHHELSGPVSTPSARTRHVAIVNIPTQGNGTDKALRRSADRHAARRRHPRDDRPRQRHADQRHRHHRRLEGLQRQS